MSPLAAAFDGEGMPTVYIVAENLQERDPLAARLAREDVVVEAFPDLQAFLSHEALDEAGCVVLDCLSSGAVVEAMIRLRAAMFEALPVIVLSPRTAVPLAVRAMKEGAADFLEKPFEETRLIGSVRAALDGSRARAERARRKRELIVRYRTLSARERDVVDAVLGGRGNREVATQLGIKPRTVETHRSNAMNKLGARTLPDLVRIWLDLRAGPAL
jgi:two-component system response regulator FixJ